jgi:metallophosphoesterase (TIGR00282 family)
MRVLFLGDIIGRAGRKALQNNLKEIKQKYQIDFTIINGENSAGGFGITEDICKDIYSYGGDVITTGNHLWDQKEIAEYIAKDGNLLKPYNFPEGTPGLGFNIYKTAKDENIMVINLIGNVFMKSDDNPFLKVEQILRKHQLGNDLKFIFVDFHAEATSEKVAMGHHLDGRVSAVVGTHQHVPTADGHILSGGTAYQTDAGMCGDYNSIIGMNKEPILERFLGMKSKKKFSPALGEATLCGVIIESDSETGLAKKIEPIKIGGVFGK